MQRSDDFDVYELGASPESLAKLDKLYDTYRHKKQPNYIDACRDISLVSADSQYKAAVKLSTILTGEQIKVM